MPHISLTRRIAEGRETPFSGSIRRACLLKRGSDYQLCPRLNDLDQLAMFGEFSLEPVAGYKVMVEMNHSSLAIIGRAEHHLVFRAVAGHDGRHEDETLVGNPEGSPPFGIALLLGVGNGKPVNLDHLLGLEGQQCRMRQRVSLDRSPNLIEHVLIAGRDLPDEPKPTWNIANLASVQEVLAKKDVSLEVDESGPTPVCHIRLGSLLPGEQGRSELLAILPQAPGRLRLHLRILGGELATPIEEEHLIETTGEVLSLDFEGYKRFFLAERARCR